MAPKYQSSGAGNPDLPNTSHKMPLLNENESSQLNKERKNYMSRLLKIYSINKSSMC